MLSDLTVAATRPNGSVAATTCRGAHRGPIGGDSVTSGDPGWVAPVGFIPSTPEVIFDLAADDPAAADAEVCVYVPSSVGPDGTRFGLFRLDPATAVWSAIGETGSTTISRRICATTPGLGRFAVGFNGATTIMTTVSATKSLRVSDGGVAGSPAQAACETSTTIDDIQAKRNFVTKMAWRKAGVAGSW